MDTLAQAGLAGNYDPLWAIIGGLIGGVGLLMVIYMGYAVGMTRMNFLRILGTMMLPRASDTVAYGVGLMAHLMLSAVFGLLHAGLLHAVDVATLGEAAGWDLVFGAAHGIVILMAMPMMLTLMHPLVRSGEIEHPGIALAGFGAMTPVGSLMAHVVYGVVTGAIYAEAVL